MHCRRGWPSSTPVPTSPSARATSPGASSRGGPPYRRLLSRAGNRVATAALGTHVVDLTSGYRAYRSEALRAVDLAAVGSEGYAFQIEMAARILGAGGTVVEVPITFHDRTRGHSKLSGRIVTEALFLCNAIWWQRRLGGDTVATGARPSPGRLAAWHALRPTAQYTSGTNVCSSVGGRT